MELAVKINCAVGGIVALATGVIAWATMVNMRINASIKEVTKFATQLNLFLQTIKPSRRESEVTKNACQTYQDQYESLLSIWKKIPQDTHKNQRKKMGKMLEELNKSLVKLNKIAVKLARLEEEQIRLYFKSLEAYGNKLDKL